MCTKPSVIRSQTKQRSVGPLLKISRVTSSMKARLSCSLLLVYAIRHNKLSSQSMPSRTLIASIASLTITKTVATTIIRSVNE